MSTDRGRPILQALSIPDLRNVLAAFHALTLGEWVLGTAVAIDGYREGGALAVGLVGFRFVPAALASLATAELGGRLGAARVLTATAIVRALCAAAVAAALLAGAPLPVVFALVWLDAAAGSAYRPAHAGLLPSLVYSPGELTAAATMSSNAKSSGQVLGALAGGVLLSAIGVSGAVFVAAGLYAASAVLSRGTGGARVPRGRPRTLRDHAHWLMRGVRTLSGMPETRRIAAWSCARALIRGLWVSLGVVASLTVLGMGQAGFGLLMAAAGVGTVGGIALSGQLVGRAHLAIPFALGLGLSCLPIAGIGLVGHAAPALALMVCWGAGMSISDVGAQALLSRVVAPSEVARVVGVIESSKLLVEGLGCLLAPALVHAVGIRDALVGCGAALFVVLVADQPGFRAIDRRARGEVERLELARGVPVFAALRVDGLEAVVAPLTSLEVAAGDEVIRQDSCGSQWYLVSGGELEISIDGFAIGRAARGDSFGERGLLRDEPRSATVRAVTAASLLVLERSDFLRAVTGTDDELLPGGDGPLTPAAALQRQHLLSNADRGAVDRLAGRAATLALGSGETLFREGDQDDRYFVVLHGAVEIWIDGALRRTLTTGDSFGEIAVLHRVPRTATATTRGETELVAVEGPQLRQTLDPGAAVSG